MTPKGYPKSKRKSCPKDYKEKENSSSKFLLYYDLPPDCKNGAHQQVMGIDPNEKGFAQVCLINWQQLRLVSFKLCQYLHCSQC